MDNLVTMLLLGGTLFALCYWATSKRKRITTQCPKCGALCHASGWSTGLMDRRTGAYIHDFKCPHCGMSFMK